MLLPSSHPFALRFPLSGKARSCLVALFEWAGLVGLAAFFAAFVACGTAPVGGSFPIVIESPRPFSEIKGYAPELGVSRVYLRPGPGVKDWPMVFNSGPSFHYAPELGVVSWYGYDHIGRKTATGAWFNPEAMTAAHKTLPFGAVVRVTRLDTDESVTVTIDDRGPYIEGRIIDLARRPAAELDLLGKGIVDCRVEVLRYPLIETGGPAGNG